MSDSDKILVFVYGTLKKGQRANHRLGENARLVGTGRSLTVYEMFGGSFPMILYATDGRPVLGEVYEIEKNTLDDLDRYEGYPSFYNRRQIYIQLLDHDRLVQAWIYYIPKKGDWVPAKHPIMPNSNGDLVWPPNKLDDAIPF